MKNTLRTCCAIAMITPIFAGDVAPAPASSPAAPVAASESYGWFVGGAGDYMIDSEEMLWSGHLGFNISDASSLFLEVGWLDFDEQVFGYEVDIDIVPVTLNYQHEWALGSCLSLYLGGGIGMGNLKIDIETLASDDDWEFVAQAFTGLVYEFTPSFQAYVGVRYLWLDDTEIGGVDVEDLDDFGVGLGLRVNF